LRSEKSVKPATQKSKTARNFRAVLCISKIELLFDWRLWL